MRRQQNSASDPAARRSSLVPQSQDGSLDAASYYSYHTGRPSPQSAQRPSLSLPPHSVASFSQRQAALSSYQPASSPTDPISYFRCSVPSAPTEVSAFVPPTYFTAIPQARRVPAAPVSPNTSPGSPRYTLSAPQSSVGGQHHAELPRSPSSSSASDSASYRSETSTPTPSSPEIKALISSSSYTTPSVLEGNTVAGSEDEQQKVGKRPTSPLSAAFKGITDPFVSSIKESFSTDKMELSVNSSTYDVFLYPSLEVGENVATHDPQRLVTVTTAGAVQKAADVIVMIKLVIPKKYKGPEKITKLTVSIDASEAMQFPSGAYESATTFQDKVEVPQAAGQVLQPDTTYHFDIAVFLPWNAAPYERCKNGRNFWQITAKATFPSLVRQKTLTASQNIFPCAGSTDPSAFSYIHEKHSFAEGLGAFHLSFISRLFSVGGYLRGAIRLPDPAPNLKIHSIQMSLVQSVTLTSRRRPDATESCGDEVFTFFTLKGEELEAHLAQTGALCRPRPGLGKEIELEWITRLPGDNHARPSTLPGNDAHIRISHQLEMTIMYEVDKDNPTTDAQGRTLHKRFKISWPVSIVSCAFRWRSLVLPEYSAEDFNPVPTLERNQWQGANEHESQNLCNCGEDLETLIAYEDEAEARGETTSRLMQEQLFPDEANYIRGRRRRSLSRARGSATPGDSRASRSRSHARANNAEAVSRSRGRTAQLNAARQQEEPSGSSHSQPRSGEQTPKDRTRSRSATPRRTLSPSVTFNLGGQLQTQRHTEGRRGSGQRSGSRSPVPPPLTRSGRATPRGAAPDSLPLPTSQAHAQYLRRDLDRVLGLQNGIGSADVEFSEHPEGEGIHSDSESSTLSEQEEALLARERRNRSRSRRYLPRDALLSHGSGAEGRTDQWGDETLTSSTESDSEDLDDEEDDDEDGEALDSLDDLDLNGDSDRDSFDPAEFDPDYERRLMQRKIEQLYTTQLHTPTNLPSSSASSASASASAAVGNSRGLVQSVDQVVVVNGYHGKNKGKSKEGEEEEGQPKSDSKSKAQTIGEKAFSLDPPTYGTATADADVDSHSYSSEAKGKAKVVKS